MSDLNGMHKETVYAPLNYEVSALAKAAKELNIPDEKDRQPDLQYMTAIFVSSGMNKNGAVFMGSELIKARDSISTKAVDIEHDEKAVIGHITDNAFLFRDGSRFDPATASVEMSLSEMDEKDIDIAIAAIIYKTRFPDLASEIKDGEWMVSMEAYYRDYDIKIGDKVIPKDEAIALGYDKLVGSVVQVKEGQLEKGFHLVGRVLRDIVFAGVGIVKNPANERSVILEAAALKEYEGNKENATAVMVNLADIETLEKHINDFSINSSPNAEKATEVDNVSDANTDRIRNIKNEAQEIINNMQLVGLDEQQVEERKKLLEDLQGAIDRLDKLSEDLEIFVKNEDKEDASILLNERRYGTCTSYKRYLFTVPNPSTDTLEDPAAKEDDQFGRPTTQFPLYNNPGGVGDTPPGSEVSREHYCNLFDLDCTARPGDAQHPDCWRNVFARNVREEVNTYTQKLRMRRLSEGLVELQKAIDEARRADIY